MIDSYQKKIKNLVEQWVWVLVYSYIVISCCIFWCVFMIDNDIAEHAAIVLKALAHPVRLQIVDELASGEKCVSDIVNAVGAKQSITSQQLNMMKDKGVLSCRRDGAKVFYKIENENVIKLLGCICNHCEKQ